MVKSLLRLRNRALMRNIKQAVKDEVNENQALRFYPIIKKRIIKKTISGKKTLKFVPKINTVQKTKAVISQINTRSAQKPASGSSSPKSSGKRSPKGVSSMLKNISAIKISARHFLPSVGRLHLRNRRFLSPRTIAICA